MWSCMSALTSSRRSVSSRSSSSASERPAAFSLFKNLRSLSIRARELSKAFAGEVWAESLIATALCSREAGPLLARTRRQHAHRVRPRPDGNTVQRREPTQRPPFGSPRRAARTVFPPSGCADHANAARGILQIALRASDVELLEPPSGQVVAVVLELAPHGGAQRERRAAAERSSRSGRGQAQLPRDARLRTRWRSRPIARSSRSHELTSVQANSSAAATRQPSLSLDCVAEVVERVLTAMDVRTPGAHGRRSRCAVRGRAPVPPPCPQPVSRAPSPRPRGSRRARRRRRRGPALRASTLPSCQPPSPAP